MVVHVFIIIVHYILSSEESYFDPEIIRIWIELGDDPNTEINGCPILIILCEHHLHDPCELILSKGANQNSLCHNHNEKHERTALITSCLKNDTKLASILLFHGADPMLK